MTKYSLLITLVFVLILSGCAGGGARNLPGSGVNWKKVSVLVYTKNGKGYVHANIPAASASLQDMGQRYGFHVTVSDNPADFNDANLQRYNAIVFNNTNNDVFDTDAQKLALMRFVQAGGGIVGIHSATGTERNWPWFKRMLGATFLRHPPHQPFNTIVVDNTHPSTRALPTVWKRDDECYYVKELNPDLHVLLVHDLTTLKDTAKPVTYGNTFPAAWCHQFDGGRQWYTALGHDSTTYRQPDFQGHLIGGLQWVIGKPKKPDYTKAHAQSPNDPLPY